MLGLRLRRDNRLDASQASQAISQSDGPRTRLRWKDGKFQRKRRVVVAYLCLLASYLLVNQCVANKGEWLLMEFTRSLWLIGEVIMCRCRSSRRTSSWSWQRNLSFFVSSDFGFVSNMLSNSRVIIWFCLSKLFDGWMVKLLHYSKELLRERKCLPSISG